MLYNEGTDTMSDRYRYGIIGTGREFGTEGATGFGMAQPHFWGMRNTGRVDLVAIAEIRDDNSQLFLSKHNVQVPVYHDYHEMLRNEHLDIVSVTTWPHLHAEMTVAACEAGAKAVHCEKPMATTWGDCKRMKAAADANGTKLTFGHQRRHIRMFQAVRQTLNDGVVGDLVVIEAQVGDMFDWGTHWLDMMQFYNNESPIEWVIGQIDSRTEKRIFGAFMENQAICHFKWTNGVRGVLIAGQDASIGTTHRIIGTKGVLEVMTERKYRILGNGNAEWREIEVPQGDVHELDLAAADVVRQLDEPGYKSILSVDYAIQHTEVIFATYESSRWRGRIDFPLQAEDSALLAMVDAGLVGPDRRP